MKNRNNFIRIAILIIALGIVGYSIYISNFNKSIDIKVNGSDGPITVLSDQNLVFSFHGRGEKCEVSQTGEGSNIDITGSGIYHSENNAGIIKDKFTMGPGSELSHLPIGNNINFPIKCFDKNGQQIGSDSVMVNVIDKYASNEFKNYSNSIFSFKYPVNFTVSVDDSGFINVSSPGCLSSLEFGEPMISPKANTTDYWLEELKKENPTSYEFEGCTTDLYNIVTSCSFRNPLGSSVKKNKLLLSKNYRVNISYIDSRLNYDNSTGQKIDPNQGVTLENVCRDAFSGITKSFSFK